MAAPAPVAAPAPPPTAAAPSHTDPNAPTSANITARITALVKKPGFGGAAKVKELLVANYGPTVTKGSDIPPEHYAHAIQLFDYYLSQ
jgi:hypothetical protein